MFIKALYVSDLHSYIDKTISRLEQVHIQVKNIQKSIEAMIALEDEFKGKLANSIRAFYQEVHMPFLLFLEGFITKYTDTLQEMKKSIQYMEPDKDGVIREDFLSQDVRRGLERMEQVTMDLTDEANAIIQSVSDIVDLPKIDDSEFLDNVQHGKKKTHKTLEKLYELDRHNTAKLEPIEQDIHMMKNYISQIRELGNNGQIHIGNYQARQLADQKFHKELIGGIRSKAVRNAVGLETVLGEVGKYLLSQHLPPANLFVHYLQKKFGLQTMDYSYRAMQAAVAASGDSLTTREFTTIEHQVVSSVKISDYKKVHQGTYYTLTDGRFVRKYQSESGNVEYKLVDAIPADRHKPKEPEKNWIEKTTQGIAKAGLHVGLAGYKTGKTGLKLSKKALDFVIVDDIKTVLDSEASTGERLWTGASIIPAGKVLKLVKAGGVIKFADKGKQTAKKVKDLDNAFVNKNNNLYRGDSLLYSPKRQNGIKKPHISNTGNLVPANKDGLYKERQVTVTEHILGGYRRGAKSNSPYTSFTNNKNVVGNYGGSTVELDISALRKNIRSGNVKDVVILSPKQIEKLIERDNYTSDFWKRRAVNWTKRDKEYLIKGEIPGQFIKVSSKE
ncbi:ribonuclease YeeF family protein [Virgibacillus sp. Bac330]|uniref:ribonuclease YeeF family protein n=1 Tax=Virgibacillus sp. Bac330 TaxID=2419841 RepID=UPI000EF54053|nr:T7SS effector LXG polymorphic toxin [Virgibacillus sp. Bac330]